LVDPTTRWSDHEGPFRVEPGGLVAVAGMTGIGALSQWLTTRRMGEHAPKETLPARSVNGAVGWFWVIPELPGSDVRML
jgi:hypothetical protein